jgi:cation diffusion facilitator family transporter
MATDGGTRAVVAALFANLGIAITKFIAYLLARNSSMLAEAIHSLADCGNQALLLLGGRRAQREATARHPFGYGRERYVYSFIVSIVLFTVGGLFALYEAYHKWQHIQEHPEDTGVDPKWWWLPLVVLGLAIVLESFSFRTAIVEANKVRHGATWLEFIRRAKAPELPVILLEDFAALLGLAFAFVGVGLNVITEEPTFDVLGTSMIGILLVLVAIVLAVETKSLLLGESATEDAQTRIESALTGPDGIAHLIHMKTMHLGPEELLVAAKFAAAPGASAEQIAKAIDQAERAIRAAEPTATHIYLEPDIFRDDYQPAERPEPPAPAGH